MTTNERFVAVREKIGFSQADFARKLNIQSSLISEIESSKRDVSKSILISLMSIFSVSIDWLLTGSGSMFVTGDTPSANPARIPLLRQTVSCGPGQEWGDADNVEAYIQPLDLVCAEKGRRIYAFRVRGTSMVGIGLYDGDIVFFDGTPTDYADDDYYVFAMNEKVYCKLIRFESIEDAVQIFSVQSTDLTKAEVFKTIRKDSEEMKTFRIFGRVIAWMHENRLCKR